VKGNALLGESVHVTFAVRNNGTVAGDEVIQIYVSSGKTAEPIKALKWFKRVNLAPSASETKFEAVLQPSAFEIFDDATGKTYVAPGKYKILVGGSSSDSALLTKEVDFQYALRVLPWGEQ
jgi:beta-glucosidase